MGVRVSHIGAVLDGSHRGNSNMANLLVNGDFSLESEGIVGQRGGFYAWQRVNDEWRLAYKPQSTPSQFGTAAEMDQDTGRNGPIGWLMNDEDWLTQVVQAPEVHSQATFTITEIHHLVLSLVQIRLYGSYDGLEWSELWLREGMVVPEAQSATDWYTNAYPVASDHTHYRLEFYGKYLDATGHDGWKITNLVLEVS